MDPDDGSADPLEDVSRTTPLGDPPTFTSDDDEGRGGSRRSGRPSRQRLPQHQMSAPHHQRPPADESSQPGQLPTARPSWGDVHDIYDDDDTEECDHSPGDRSHREENDEEEATVASLSTMDTETFKRLRDHRRLLKGSGNSDSTEVTRNDRYRDRGDGRGSSRRRRRRDDDSAVSHASHSYAPSHHSYNSHNSHHTASTASSEAPAYGNSRSRTHSRARHHTSGSSRRGKPSRGMRYPIPWQAVLLFALGTVLMAKMGVIELKLEKSQGRFLRGGEELVDEMNYRVGGVEVVRQRREEDVSAEDEGEEVQSEGEGEGKEIPKGDEKESAVDELLGEDEAKREGIEYSKVVEPAGSLQSEGNEQREADALSALPDLSPDNNPEVAPAVVTDSKEPPSEQYFRKSLEELIQRMDSQRGGNADDDSFQADETPQQQQQLPEDNVDEQQEQLALEQDREARQEQAQLIEERQKQQPLLTVNAGMDEQQHASAAAAAFGLNPEKHFPDQNLGSQPQSEAQRYNGGLAEWQAQFDHSHGQNPQQLPPQPLQQQSTPDVSVSEHLRNLPLFSQGHSGNHHLQAQQEKQPDLQTSHQYLSQSQTLAQDNGLQTPQQPIAPQQLEPLSPDQIQQQIQQQQIQPQQPQQQAHQEQQIQQGTYQNQNLDGPPQQQQQLYTYVQQQVPLVGQQPHVAPAQNVIIGQQAHQRGDSSQFAVVGGSFVHAVDADGNVVNDSNAPASGGGHLLASKASRGMQLGADGAPVPDAPGEETNAEGAVEGGGSDDVQQNANSAPEPDTSGTNTNESPEADAGEEDGVDLLSKDPFHNDSRHFRREAPLHLFTDEEKKKLATLEKEEEQQAQTGDNTHREVADNEPSSAGDNEAKEEPAQPPKRSVDDGIAHDNPRLWGVK